MTGNYDILISEKIPGGKIWKNISESEVIMTIEQIIFIFTIGVVVGTAISNIVRIIWMSDGTLNIDQTDPYKDLYKLEINELDILPKKKTIILRVVVKSKRTPK